jgi:signal transduction histidine kinase
MRRMNRIALDLRSPHLRLGSNCGFVSFPHVEEADEIGITLPDGAMISVKLPPDERQLPFWMRPWIATLLFGATSVTLLGLWAARALTALVRRGRRKLQSQRHRRAAPPTRPRRNSSVAEALKCMRERITALIDDRTRMLAVISHDLRTPITRMRLRSNLSKTICITAACWAISI